MKLDDWALNMTLRVPCDKDVIYIHKHKHGVGGVVESK